MFFKSPADNGLSTLAQQANLDQNTPIIRFISKEIITGDDMSNGRFEIREDIKSTWDKVLKGFKALFSLPEGRKIA